MIKAATIFTKRPRSSNNNKYLQNLRMEMVAPWSRMASISSRCSARPKRTSTTRLVALPKSSRHRSNWTRNLPHGRWTVRRLITSISRWWSSCPMPCPTSHLRMLSTFLRPLNSQMAPAQMSAAMVLTFNLRTISSWLSIRIFRRFRHSTRSRSSIACRRRHRRKLVSIMRKKISDLVTYSVFYISDPKMIKTDFNNLLNSVAQQQQHPSISPQPIVKLQQPGAFQSQASNKPTLITPAMFQTTNVVEEKIAAPAPSQSNIRPEPLTQNQLLQALNYMLESDPEFIRKIHEAYVKSFNKMVSL